MDCNTSIISNTKYYLHDLRRESRLHQAKPGEKFPEHHFHLTVPQLRHLYILFFEHSHSCKFLKYRSHFGTPNSSALATRRWRN